MVNELISKYDEQNISPQMMSDMGSFKGAGDELAVSW